MLGPPFEMEARATAMHGLIEQGQNPVGLQVRQNRVRMVCPRMVEISQTARLEGLQ